MILSKYDHHKTLDIWTIRGHDNVVLINDSHLDKKIPHYRIIFTKNKSRAGKEYYLSYKTIKKSKKEMHKSRDGRDILRYAVPTSKLEDFIIQAHSLYEI